MTRLILFLFLGACLLGVPPAARSASPPIDSLQMRLTPMISAILADGNGDGTPDRIGDTLAVSGRVTASPAQLSHVRSSVGPFRTTPTGFTFVSPTNRSSAGATASLFGDGSCRRKA